MSVLYSIYRDNRKESDRLYYGRAIHLNTLGTMDLADRVQQNCSMKKSDVLAVIQELVEVMKYELQNSNLVRLDGFGTFGIHIKTVGAPTADKFDAGTNIKGSKVNFLPAGQMRNGKMTRVFTDNVKYKKYGE